MTCAARERDFRLHEPTQLHIDGKSPPSDLGRENEMRQTGQRSTICAHPSIASFAVAPYPLAGPQVMAGVSLSAAAGAAGRE
jgi:hypothetical protein